MSPEELVAELVRVEVEYLREPTPEGFKDMYYLQGEVINQSR
jgi:hypothetical protein